MSCLFGFLQQHTASTSHVLSVRVTTIYNIHTTYVLSVQITTIHNIHTSHTHPVHASPARSAAPRPSSQHAPSPASSCLAHAQDLRSVADHLLSTPAEQLEETILSPLAELLADVLTDHLIVPSEESLSAAQREQEAQRIRDVERFLCSTATLLRALAATKDTELPVSCTKLVCGLNLLLVELFQHKAYLPVAEISQLCEVWWVQERAERAALIPQLLPVTLLGVVAPLAGPGAKALSPATCLSRMCALCESLVLIDWSDPNSRYLQNLLLRCAVHPAVLSSTKGTRFCAHLLCLAPCLTTALHKVLTYQLLSCPLEQACLIGGVYFRGWRESSGECTRVLEDECIQDLMGKAVGAPTVGVFRALAAVLGEFHKHKVQDGVDSMLYRLYQPVLWRSLSVPNASVRRNAACLLFDAFPLIPALSSRERDDAIRAQLRDVARLLRDPNVGVRRAAVKGAAERVLCQSWELLPSDEASKLVGLVVETCFDGAAASVRVDSLRGVGVLLGNYLAHPVVARSLPTLAPLVHDPCERVRVELLDVLLKVQCVRDFVFTDVVPLERLLYLLVTDTRAVAKKVAELLCGTYFPFRKGSKSVLKRALALYDENPKAALQFYTLALDFVPARDVCKLLWRMWRTLTLHCAQRAARATASLARDTPPRAAGAPRGSQGAQVAPSGATADVQNTSVAGTSAPPARSKGRAAARPSLPVQGQDRHAEKILSRHYTCVQLLGLLELFAAMFVPMHPAVERAEHGHRAELRRAVTADAVARLQEDVHRMFCAADAAGAKLKRGRRRSSDAPASVANMPDGTAGVQDCGPFTPRLLEDAMNTLAARIVPRVAQPSGEAPAGRVAETVAHFVPPFVGASMLPHIGCMLGWGHAGELCECCARWLDPASVETQAGRAYARLGLDIIDAVLASETMRGAYLQQDAVAAAALRAPSDLLAKLLADTDDVLADEARAEHTTLVLLTLKVLLKTLVHVQLPTASERLTQLLAALVADAKVLATPPTDGSQRTPVQIRAAACAELAVALLVDYVLARTPPTDTLKQVVGYVSSLVGTRDEGLATALVPYVHKLLFALYFCSLDGGTELADGLLATVLTTAPARCLSSTNVGDLMSLHALHATLLPFLTHVVRVTLPHVVCPPVDASTTVLPGLTPGSAGASADCVLHACVKSPTLGTCTLKAVCHVPVPLPSGECVA